MPTLAIIEQLDPTTLKYCGFIILPLVMLGMLLSTLKRTLELRDNHFSRGKLKQIKEALACTQEDSLQDRYVQQVINTEVFRLTSGLRTTDKHAAALMHLCLNGLESSNRLKSLDEFIEVQKDGSIRIVFNWFDRAYARFNLIAGAISLAAGVGLIIYLFIQAGFSLVTVLTALGIELITIGFVLWFAWDYAKFFRAKRIQKRLLAEPLPPCPELCRLSGVRTSQSVSE